MTNMEDEYGVVLNCEQNPIHMRWVAVKEMAHFKWEDFALRRQWTPLRKFGKRCDGILQCQKPHYAGFSGVTG